jgi:hypothetical protein
VARASVSGSARASVSGSARALVSGSARALVLGSALALVLGSARASVLVSALVRERALPSVQVSQLVLAPVWVWALGRWSGGEEVLGKVSASV